MLAGDRDRERAAAVLREHYAQGRLTLDEVSSRVDTVLSARSRGEIRRALSGLPTMFGAEQGLAFARRAGRVALLVAFTGAYLLFCFSLLLVAGLTMLVQGLSAAAVAVLFLAWLVPTYLLSRLWRPPHGRRRSA